jgi:YD repeat-containing protein
MTASIHKFHLISVQYDSSVGGVVTNWIISSHAYDGLNRVIAGVDRDGVLTAYAYDLMSDLTNSTMPLG